MSLPLTLASPSASAAASNCRSNPVDGAKTLKGFCAFTWASGTTLRCFETFSAAYVFSSVCFFSGLSQPRAIDLASNGDLLIVEVGNGRISANFEGDDGALNSTTLYQSAGLSLTHGLRYFNDSIYASSDTTVYRSAVLNLTNSLFIRLIFCCQMGLFF